MYLSVRPCQAEGVGMEKEDYERAKKSVVFGRQVHTCAIIQHTFTSLSLYTDVYKLKK